MRNKFLLFFNFSANPSVPRHQVPRHQPGPSGTCSFISCCHKEWQQDKNIKLSHLIQLLPCLSGHKMMFHGWNTMILALQHLQKVEKQMICITKALCQGRVQSPKECSKEKRANLVVLEIHLIESMVLWQQHDNYQLSKD